MVDNDFVSERTVEYVLVQPERFRSFVPEWLRFIKNPEGTAPHLAVRVCEIGPDGQQASCDQTTVLERVTLNRAEAGGNNTNTEDSSSSSPWGGPLRHVSTVFWYDAETLYIGYEEYSLTHFMEGGRLDAQPGQAVPPFVPQVRKCSLHGTSLECVDQESMDEYLLFWEDVM